MMVMYQGKLPNIPSSDRVKVSIARRDWSAEAFASVVLAIIAVSSIVLITGSNAVLSTALILLGGVACLFLDAGKARITALVIAGVLAFVALKSGVRMNDLLLAPMAIITCEGMNRIHQRLVLTERAANVDKLTGALTVRGFARVLGRELMSACKEGRSTALIFIDLDHFKSVNDTFGHSAGDSVLCELVQNLKSRLLSTDHIARVGGDEFLVFLRYADDADKIKSFQNKMLQAVSDLSHNLTASAGGLILPPNVYSDPTSIIESADRLMYEVKNSGRGEIKFDELRA